MKERKPIFDDERRRRWALTRRVLEINGVVFTLLLVIFLLAVITRPNLPELLLPETRPALHAVRPKQPAKPAPTRIGRRRRVAAPGKGHQKYETLRAALAVKWETGTL